jgi:hypothetical protein
VWSRDACHDDHNNSKCMSSHFFYCKKVAREMMQKMEGVFVTTYVPLDGYHFFVMYCTVGSGGTAVQATATRFQCTVRYLLSSRYAVP